MDIYAWIYISIIFLGIALTIAFILYKSVLQSRIQKQYLNKEEKANYVEQLNKFKSEYNIVDEDSVYDIAKKVGLVIEECDRKKMESGYDGRIENEKIKITKDLSIRKKNVIIAHEIAHFLRKDTSNSVAGCKTKTLFVRKKDEQICDYIASIILLPENELKERMINSHYNNMVKSSRSQFVAQIAEEKNISMSVVIKRIQEFDNI